MMIGLSMALTIAVCVGGFSLIYASLDTFIGDFVSQDVPTAVVPTQQLSQVAAADAPSPAPAQAQPTQAAVPRPTAPPVSETPPAAFTPDFQSGGYTLNLRSEPSSEGGETTIVIVLPPATPLQYLNEEAPTANPAQDGDRWMRFKTEAGQEGWLRELDTETYQP
jgi:hypothetical protein